MNEIEIKNLKSPTTSDKKISNTFVMERLIM